MLGPEADPGEKPIAGKSSDEDAALRASAKMLLQRVREEEPDTSAEIYPPPLELGANATVDCTYWGADFRERFTGVDPDPDPPLLDHLDAEASLRFGYMVEATHSALRPPDRDRAHRSSS